MLTINMKFFNVYYFCDLANETMGKFAYDPNFASFVDEKFGVDPEEFPKISVLREFCYWLVETVIWEQVRFIDNGNEKCEFNPVDWICQAAKKYKNVTLDSVFASEYNYEMDYSENFNLFVEKIDELYCDIIWNIATEVEYILFQNREFLVRFNKTMASKFRNNTRKRVYMPEWVKRAILFRDRGCCVFCKRDLTGRYTLSEDREKQFDHIVPIEEGGLNDVCNIQLTCQKCNLEKYTESKTSTLYQTAY